eukprot:TRINITY_DN6654_c0_g2_i1.p1 TRINITY_DN6654_c0_g2~~TRINITY_DN6654_c0_g2_i1.p1  ORF type:complete len:273 (+),score=48.40 TRINITY_DN6654_c0_g2_i1:568-1386(+)
MQPPPQLEDMPFDSLQTGRYTRFTHDLLDISKKTSQILRHDPPQGKMLKNGFIQFEEVVKILRQQSIIEGTEVGIQRLGAAIKFNSKSRFKLCRDGAGEMWVSANQGHSAWLQIEAPGAIDRAGNRTMFVQHATYETNLPNIQDEGLKGMSRAHVHFYGADDPKSFGKVRMDADRFIIVDLHKWLREGRYMGKSDNNVFLADAVPAEFVMDNAVISWQQWEEVKNIQNITDRNCMLRAYLERNLNTAHMDRLSACRDEGRKLGQPFAIMAQW